MKIKRPESTGLVSINMTPMIDCVFNLLIFFVLTSQFAKLAVEEVVLPLSTEAVNKEWSQFRNIVINIKNPDNPQMIVNGAVYGLDDLTQLLREAHADAGEGNINVILRADADICYEEVARAMLATGRAKIQGWWVTAEIDKSKEKQAQP